MMSFKPGPCLTCTERHEGCHGTCAGYKAWRAEFDARKEKIEKEKLKGKQLDDFRSESVKRTKKRLRK